MENKSKNERRQENQKFRELDQKEIRKNWCEMKSVGGGIYRVLGVLKI